MDICFCHQCAGSSGSGEYFKVGEMALVPLRLSRVLGSVNAVGETVGLLQLECCCIVLLVML